MITRFAVSHPVAVLVFCAAAVLAGAWGFSAMPRESFPDVKIPLVIVTTTLHGANPADVETSITVPLETELKGLEGLKEMKSTSAEGISLVVLEFQMEVDTEVSLARVRDRVDKAKQKLPQEADEPVVREASVSDMPVLIYNIAGSSKVALSEIYDLADRIKDRLLSVPGVLEVEILGGRERRIIVELDMDRLNFHRLSMDQVLYIIRGTNQNTSAGATDGPKSRVVVRAPGEFRSPEDVFKLVIGVGPGGVPIHIGDVASVRYGFEDELSRARVYDFRRPGTESPSGGWVEPMKSVSIQVKKRSGENMLRVVRDSEAAVHAVPFSREISVTKSVDMSKEVNAMLSDLENNMATALILVLGVIFVAMGMRNAVLVSMAVPFTLLISFVCLHFLGQTLNMIVMFSLVLALGMLVDDAIVIMENIYRHHSMGASRAEAAIEGTAEMLVPVVSSTLTTVVAFFPLLFWPDVMGEFMGYMPLTVIVVLMCSLFVALVINPTMALFLMRRGKKAEGDFDPETQRPRYPLALRYGRALEFMLRRPGWTLLCAVLMLFLSFAAYGAFGCGVEFFPTLDPSMVTMSVTPPEGASLAESDRLCRLLEDRIFGKEGSGYSAPVTNLKLASVTVGSQAGWGSWFGDEGGAVKAQVEFADRELRSESTNETVKEMRRRIDGLDASGRRVTWPLYGAEFDVFQRKEGPPTGKPVSVEIFGEELGVMAGVVRDMKAMMRQTPGVAKPTDNAELSQPTLEWTVDRDRAGIFGLSQAAVGQFLQIAVGGLKSGTFGHGDDEQDIDIRMPERYRLSTAMMNDLAIPLPTGPTVPLSAIASCRLVPGPVSIQHHGGARMLMAGAEVQPGVREDAVVRNMFHEKVAGYRFPAGITHRFTGAAEEQEKAMDFLGKAFLAALILIMLILVIEFDSLVHTGIIMSSVILSFMGVFLGLILFRQPFGIIMSGIGVISLAGVVVKNAIVLLDAIRRFERRGLPVHDAIVTACMIRLRPVLLTAVTAILGLAPMAAKVNLDFAKFTIEYNTEPAQMWQSLSISIIFGLLVATVLTLGVVPALYLLYARARGVKNGSYGPSAASSGT